VKQVYLSSTFKDLKRHRAAATEALMQIGCHVKRMEEYPARPEHTRMGCEADVDACDIYVGVFAWRYGHVPKVGNPEKRSITELEFRRAECMHKPCLIFLLDEKWTWPKARRDSETGEGDRGQRIESLRDDLSQRMSARFTTPDSLGRQVIASVYSLLSTRTVQRLKVIDEIGKAEFLGPSYMENVQRRIVEVVDREIVEIRIGATPWWSTRLHLVAALACDFTRIRQLLFVADDGRFLAMTTPAELRRALTWRELRLERAYLASRTGVLGNTVEGITMEYEHNVSTEFGGRIEKDVTEVITAVYLERGLGLASSAELIELAPGQPQPDARVLLERRLPFIAVQQPERSLVLIDRDRLASQFARGQAADI
jgi:hypothetical protein